MGPEIWVGIAAVFVSGGAIGSAGTLLAQWLLKRFDVAGTASRGSVPSSDSAALRAEIADLQHHVRNMDARLDFTEQLLDGAIPLAPPPARIPADDAPGGHPDPGEPST